MVWRSFCLYTDFSISNVSIAKSLYVFEARSFGCFPKPLKHLPPASRKGYLG